MNKKDVENLKVKYEKLRSNESIDYMKKILLEFGQEIQKRFPGVDFILKARIKSPKSYNDKINKLRKKSPIGKKDIYDGIGFCLIIKSVADDFDFNHALCSLNVKKRMQIKLNIANEKSGFTMLKRKHKKIIKQYEEIGSVQEIKEELEKLKSSETKNEHLIKILENSLKSQELLKSYVDELIINAQDKNAKIVKLGNDYYMAIDNKINEMIGIHIMNKLTNDEKFMSNLGLEIVPNRKKFHDGGKSGYYIAYHDTLGSTNKEFESWWDMEAQSVSYENYVNSKEGTAKHSQCEGKSRTFPMIGETKEEQKRFIEEVLNSAPQNYVYENGKYEHGQTIKKGSVYKCSDIENVVYYYVEELKGQPDLFKYIVSDEELFEDKNNEFYK